MAGADRGLVRLGSGRGVHLEAARRSGGGQANDVLIGQVVAEADGSEVVLDVAARERLPDGALVELDVGQAQQTPQRDHVAEQLLAEVLRPE